MFFIYLTLIVFYLDLIDSKQSIEDIASIKSVKVTEIRVKGFTQVDVDKNDAPIAVEELSNNVLSVTSQESMCNMASLPFVKQKDDDEKNENRYNFQNSICKHKSIHTSFTWDMSTNTVTVFMKTYQPNVKIYQNLEAPLETFNSTYDEEKKLTSSFIILPLDRQMYPVWHPYSIRLLVSLTGPAIDTLEYTMTHHNEKHQLKTEVNTFSYYSLSILQLKVMSKGVSFTIKDEDQYNIVARKISQESGKHQQHSMLSLYINTTSLECNENSKMKINLSLNENMETKLIVVKYKRVCRGYDIRCHLIGTANQGNLNVYRCDFDMKPRDRKLKNIKIQWKKIDEFTTVHLTKNGNVLQFEVQIPYRIKVDEKLVPVEGYTLAYSPELREYFRLE